MLFGWRKLKQADGVDVVLASPKKQLVYPGLALLMVSEKNNASVEK
jgi:aspartate aminotransferase-like enzyme